VLFRVSGKVHSFHLRGKRFFPGEVVELSSEEMQRLNLDFLERIDEDSAGESVVDGAAAVTIVESEVKAEPLEVRPEAKSKIKPKTLPKVQP
jgi:hypothetical protein